MLPYGFSNQTFGGCAFGNPRFIKGGLGFGNREFGNCMFGSPRYLCAGKIRFYREYIGRLWWKCIGATQSIANEDTHQWLNWTKGWICFNYAVPSGTRRATNGQQIWRAAHANATAKWFTLTLEEQLEWVAKASGKPITGITLYIRSILIRTGFGKCYFGSSEFGSPSPSPVKFGFGIVPFGYASFGSCTS